MEGILELLEVARGGLQQALKNLSDDARMRVVKRLGTGKDQAVAYGLQRRSRRTLGKTEGRFLPSLWAKSTGENHPALMHDIYLRQGPRRASGSKTFLPTGASNR